jgi:hypothetical protein
MLNTKYSSLFETRDIMKTNDNLPSNKTNSPENHDRH